MKYIKLFDKIVEFESVKDVLDRPNVSLIQETNSVAYLPDTLEDIIAYSKEYFTIQSLEDNNEVSFSNNIMYQLEGLSTWSTLNSGEKLVLNTNQEVKFKINNPDVNGSGVGTFSASKQYNVKGNIMSLLYGDDFKGKVDLPGKNFAFFDLFNSSTTLISAENLILPATTLVEGCYDNMFYGCTNLITAPALPATTLDSNCYYYMFQNCTSLTIAPALPATDLALSCYTGMFEGCTSLEIAPALPATSLQEECYANMFSGCTNLTTAPVLPATTLVNYCYNSMFRNCTSLNYIKALFTTTPGSKYTSGWVSGVAPTGTFIKSEDATWDVTGDNGVPTGWTVTNVDYSTKYLTFDALEDELTVSFSKSGLEYRIDDGQWTSLSANTNTPTINTGQTISFRGNLTPTYYAGLGKFTVSKQYNISGNIMSLLYGDDFEGKVDLTGKSYAFYKLFNGSTTLISAENLILPATTLDGLCYGSMFQSCTGLTTAPALPATTLDDSCYNGMFEDCTGLTTAPELPTTDLAWMCYKYMFKGCTGLTTAPELPATTLAPYCYESMFEGCTDLTTAPELPVTKLDRHCYRSMFKGCTGLTAAPELPATTLADNCYNQMFRGCTDLTTAPELPATTLADYCYDGMFWNCTSLTTAPELQVTTLANSCYSNMFYGCTGLTAAPELPATTLANGCYRSMFSGCTGLTAAPELPATTLADQCYQSMFAGCTSLTTAPSILPATTLANTCYYDMFSSCTSLTKAPELPATILVDYCYYNMFWNCWRLNYIKMLATDISATDCLKFWLDNVYRTGTFVKSKDATWDVTLVILEGWTVENV